MHEKVTSLIAEDETERLIAKEREKKQINDALEKTKLQLRKINTLTEEEESEDDDDKETRNAVRL